MEFDDSSDVLIVGGCAGNGLEGVGGGGGGGVDTSDTSTPKFLHRAASPPLKPADTALNFHSPL